MPIAWNEIKPVISGQIQQSTGLDKDQVRWVDEKGANTNGLFPVIWLRITNVKATGWDEARFMPPAANAPTDDLIPILVGQRSFTLSIRCESFTPDETDPLHSKNIIETVKTRIWFDSYIEQRYGVFAINDDIAVKWFNYVEDNRQMSCAVMDLMCSTMNIEINDAPNAGAWIDEVLINSTPIYDEGATAATVADNTAGATTDQVVLDVVRPPDT